MKETRCTGKGGCHVLEKGDVVQRLYLLCLQPLITLDGSISYTFPSEGMHTVAVQVAAGNTILQDTKTIAVKGQYLFSICATGLYSCHLFSSIICSNTAVLWKAAKYFKIHHFRQLSYSDSAVCKLFQK